MRVSGTVFFKINGVQRNAKGNFTYNRGSPKREPIIGPDTVHGYKEMPQVAMIEGEITDSPDISLEDLTNMEGETLTLELANGKTFVLSDAWYAADGNAQTEEGNLQILFHSARPGRELT